MNFINKRKPSVKHHYVPRFYLSNFTEIDDNNAKLWVTDQKQCKQWKASPIGIAFQKDLYSLDNTPEDDFPEPDIVESAFGKVESKVAPVIREIIKTEKLPKGEDFNLLINFVALMAMRTPKMIENRDKWVFDISEKMLEMSLSSEERWQTITSNMIAEGRFTHKEVVDYHKMRDFFKSKEYTLKLNQNFKIRQLFESIDILIPLLAKRKWSLILSKDITTTYPPLGGFICSDNPVALVSLNYLPPLYSPGFGMLGTEVTMPLSKNAAIWGRFEGKEEVTVISVKGMAAINSRTGMYADQFLYHSNKNFIMINNHQQICNVQCLLDYNRIHPPISDD